MSHVSANHNWAKMTSRVFVLLTAKLLETQNSRFMGIRLFIISEWPLLHLVNRELSDGSDNWSRVGRRDIL